MGEYRDILNKLIPDENVKGVILRSAKDAFIAGADLTSADTFGFDQIQEDKVKAVKEDTLDLLSSLRDRLIDLTNWKSEIIKEEINTFVNEQEIGFAKIGLPLRLSLTGSLNSPSIDRVCELLGKEEVIERVDFAIKNLN